MRAWLGLAIAASLVLSQSLGLLHRAVHGQADAKEEQRQVVKNTAGPTGEAGRFVASLEESSTRSTTGSPSIP